MCIKDSGKTSELTPGPRAGAVPIPTKPQLPRPHLVQVGAQELDLKCYSSCLPRILKALEASGYCMNPESLDQ